MRTNNDVSTMADGGGWMGQMLHVFGGATTSSLDTQLESSTSPSLNVATHLAPPQGNTNDDDGSNNGNNNDNNNNNNNNDSSKRRPRILAISSRLGPPITSSLGMMLPPFAHVWKAALGLTFGLYVLNQRHLLPRPLSAVVSQVLFWPTLPITLSRRMGSRYLTEIDNVVIIGAAPFSFLRLPDKLHQKYNVRGVINLCAEYKGPTLAYKRLGMKHLHLPTTDHFEPSFQDLKSAVEFIEKHQADTSGKVYVHCRAGHGRSAAIVFAWLLSQSDPLLQTEEQLQQLNQELLQKRNVRKHLWQQPNIRKFNQYLWIKRRGQETAEEEGNDVDGDTANKSASLFDESGEKWEEEKDEAETE